MTMMKALVKREAGKGIWMEQVPVPTPGPNEVLIRLEKTAICGTDLHIYLWDEWSQRTIKPGLVIGHEFVGRIVDLGPGVTGYKVGQRVSAEGHIVCGHCRNCRAGRQHLCPNTIGIGVNRDGAFAEFIVMPASNLWPIPDQIPSELAAFFDPYGNAAHCALEFDVVGEDVLITGAGPIGIMAVSIARFVGARHIVITDVNDYRLELARQMGATRAINVTRESLDDTMKSLGMQEGFDVGLEMSGNASAFRELIRTMHHGGSVALLGIPPGETAIDWNQVIFKGLTLKGIYGREMFETWYKMASLLQSGLKLAPIITHHFAVQEFKQGFETMGSGKSGKVILDWTSL
jgi:threonine 3-dehydrogenase